MDIGKKLSRLGRLRAKLQHKINMRRARGMSAPEAKQRLRNVEKKRDALESLRDPEQIPAGTRGFDGHQVAGWIYPWLERIRDAGWTGTITSGYRSPAYSTSLCERMCGAPSCPGRCAGASSNHSGVKYPGGAVDVTEYEQFGRLAAHLGAPLRNALPTTDPVHFSVSGR